MLDSSSLRFVPYVDNRTKKEPSFVGTSGPLLIGSGKDGQKYIIKHTYPHNAANEFTACWLAERLGVYAPKAFLLTKNKKFNSPYAVAIEYIEGFEYFAKDAVPNKADLISQFALNALIYTDDILQLNRVGNRVISYDFSESFCMTSPAMRSAIQMFDLNEEKGIDQIAQILHDYRYHLSFQKFDIPGLAKEFYLDPDEMRLGMITTAKRLLEITEKDITELSDELCELYPVAIAVFYEECIHAMQQHMEKLELK